DASDGAAADAAPSTRRRERVRDDLSTRQEGMPLAGTRADVPDAATRRASFRAALGAPLTASSARQRAVEQRAATGAAHATAADSGEAALLASQSDGQLA